MVNAHKELSKIFEDLDNKEGVKVVRAEMEFEDEILAVLDEGHTQEEWESFLKKLDFDYKVGSYEPMVDGLILLSDGSFILKDVSRGDKPCLWGLRLPLR